MIAARISGESGRVIAFEPCARTAGRLRKNIEANHLKNVSCQQMALSDAKGEMQMQVSLDGFDAWNSLAADSNAVVESGASETVVTDTWDSVEEALCQSEKPAMIKVDIEGWESRFLRGAGRSMIGPRAPEVLQLEFNDEAAKAAGSCGKEVYQSLTSYGYQLFTYQPDVRALVAEPIQDHYSYVNLLATKDPVFVNQRLKTGKVPEWMR
jgi:FkbM family methyltransferase